jgi:predicted GNAT superfamily acetyltransferase
MMNADTVLIRPCQGLEELDACVQVQSDVWGWAERDLVPRRVFIVAQKIGGQVLGAFEGGSLVGFALAIPGIYQGRPYLHSYMLAVNPDYRNQGIGRRLKLSQRDEADRKSVV